MSLLTCVERRLLHVASGSECCWGEEDRGALAGRWWVDRFLADLYRAGSCRATYGRLYCSAASRALVMAIRMSLSKVGRPRRALTLGEARKPAAERDFRVGGGSAATSVRRTRP
jgi:hypothetical protein